MKTVAFHTLGCKLNFTESSALLRDFIQNGYTQVDFTQKADVYVVNTCTVTSIAEKKCRNAIHRARRENPNAIIAIIGCYTQIHSQDIAQSEDVDIILGNTNKHLLLSYIEQKQKDKDKQLIDVASIDRDHLFVPSFSFSDRTRSFLKIQDGCDYFCTYCEVPYARGRSRSDSITNTVARAQELAAEGKKEIVLTGVNIGEFGKDHGETFFDLIKALDSVEKIERYRISSIEPNLITDQIIDYVASSRAFLPHFHIPLQAGTNYLLERMKRKYHRELFAQKINHIHSVMPHAFLAADVIVGFPGEDNREFKEEIDFLCSIPLSALHIFTYSERPNTPAINFDGKVPIAKRKERSLILQDLSKKMKDEFYIANTGRKSKILWEADYKNEFMFGFTENYIRCARPKDSSLVNTITEETITTLSQDKEYFLI